MGGSAAAERPVGGGIEAPASVDARRPPSAAEVAWLAALPAALVVVAAIAVLGPPLGDLLFPPSGVVFWPFVANVFAPPLPEPTEHARYLVALSGPLVLSGLVPLGMRRVVLLRESTIARLVVGTQAALLAFLAICVAVQYRHTFHAEVTPSAHVVYFKPATLLVAGALACAIVAAVRSERVRRGLAAAFRESRTRRIVATAVAVVAVAISMLPAVNFEQTIGTAHEVVVEHMSFWFDEAFAFLNGHAPLVDFAAQYGSLWLYPVAGTMALVGASMGVFTVAMSLISAAAMLAVFATVRRVTRSATGALLLFLPLLATSFFMMEGTLTDRYAVGNLFSTFPLRYAGPLLLLWAVAAHLDGARPRRRWVVFLGAGLVVLNNVDFGLPALGATLAALVWADGRPTARGLRQLAVELAIGCVGALALVSLLTLLVAGSLPHLDLLVRYSRLFALAGFAMLPMEPTIGVSTIVYVTYVAAIGVATVRAVRGEPDRLMTGLLAWSGVFGLGIGSYYIGRSHPEVLTNMFAAWALSLTLLVVVALRALRARPSHLPTLAEAACLFGFGVFVCSLAQMPAPWSQVARLRDRVPPLYAQPIGEPFVALHTRPHETVALLTSLGHRTAYILGIDDVTPYTGGRSMPTIDQFDETLRLLRQAGGRKVFFASRSEWPDLPQALKDRGYRLAAREAYGLVEYVRRAPS